MDALKNEQPLAVTPRPEPEGATKIKSFDVDTYQLAVIRAIKEGAKDRDDILKRAREFLGKSRLGPQIRVSLENAISSLQARKLLVCVGTG